MSELEGLVIEMTREMLEAEDRVVPDLDAETPLFGGEGVLDSMGIVSLIVAIEQEIEDRHEIAVSLADERALSQTSGPYRTVGSLAAYAAEVMSSAS